MKTVADFKRLAKPGVVLDVTNHRYPELSGRRKVVKAQTQSVCLTLPAHHPRSAESEGSWLDIPKASTCTFADGAMTIYSNGEPFCTIREIA